MLALGIGLPYADGRRIDRCFGTRNREVHFKLMRPRRTSLSLGGTRDAEFREGLPEEFAGNSAKGLYEIHEDDPGF